MIECKLILLLEKDVTLANSKGASIMTLFNSLEICKLFSKVFANFTAPILTFSDVNPVKVLSVAVRDSALIISDVKLSIAVSAVIINLLTSLDTSTFSSTVLLKYMSPILN